MAFSQIARAEANQRLVDLKLGTHKVSRDGTVIPTHEHREIHNKPREEKKNNPKEESKNQPKSGQNANNSGKDPKSGSYLGKRGAPDNSSKPTFKQLSSQKGGYK